MSFLFFRVPVITLVLSIFSFERSSFPMFLCLRASVHFHRTSAICQMITVIWNIRWSNYCGGIRPYQEDELGLNMWKVTSILSNRHPFYLTWVFYELLQWPFLSHGLRHPDFPLRYRTGRNLPTAWTEIDWELHLLIHGNFFFLPIWHPAVQLIVS